MYVNTHYPFALPPLPYGYSALEPYIDTLTMRLHHDRHLKTYVDNLNKALANYPQYQDWSLERLILESDAVDGAVKTQVKNNAGGVFNHVFFFGEMAGRPLGPDSSLSHGIAEAFGGMERFKQKFAELAAAVFGSGYAWLTEDNAGNLKLISTANQDTPMPLGLNPLLCLDVWEHAYYLKHYNMRGDYISAWLELMSGK